MHVIPILFDAGLKNGTVSELSAPPQTDCNS